MCRGFQQSDQSDRLLKIKAFYLSLSLPKSKSNSPKPLPDSLTLHYLPRINGGPLEVNGSVFRPDSPAFLTLYRLLSDDAGGSGRNSVAYGSREKVRVSEGVRFEVYLREERLVRGGFRKDDEGGWRMECKCGLEGGEAVEVKDVEVCVAAEGGGGEVEVVMREAVEMVVRRKRGRCFKGLEEIPEQREESVEEYSCCCCDCGGDSEVVDDGGEAAEDGGEVEVEGVRWAVDVGIWVVCLGVGYFVSKASMRRRRRLL